MTPSNPIVLVIDDEFGPRESLRVLLKNKYTVHCADSALQGLKLLQELSPDLVILDIRMPNITGTEALRRIREIDQHVSLVMLTGFGALETAQEALRLGANDYVKKPFDIKEMMEIVGRNVQRTQGIRRRIQIAEELKEFNSRLLSEMVKKEHMASLGQASAELVHDLRTPLSVVQGYLQLLQKKLRMPAETPGKSLEETLEFLDIINENVRRCCELAEVWQNLGRKDSSRIKRASISRILNEIVRAAEHMANRIGARVELRIELQEQEILVDSIQIFRAIQNVVVNAIESIAGKDGLVQISCTQKGSSIEIRVQDNGCGMNEEHLRHIFDPYFTTKASHKGTGLGLLITQKVIEDHAGTIQVESKVNDGTVVTIQLPLPDLVQAGFDQDRNAA